jgi:competence protein ComEC
LRPLGCAALGLALGIGLGRECAADLDWGGLVWAAGFAALAGWLALWRGRGQALAWAFLLAGFAAGLARVQPLAQASAAPPGVERPAIRLQASVALDEGPRVQNQRHLYVLESVQIQDLRDSGAPWETWPGRVRASLDLEQAAALGFLPGDRIQAYGNLHALEGPSNPGEFDYRSYLLGRGIDASFSARPDWPSRRSAAGPWYLPRRLAAQAQAWMIRGLSAGLQGRPLVLARGIVLGDKGGLTREDAAEYSRSGFADLLAVSGTHFTLALGLFLFVARFFTPSKRKQAALGLLLGIAYALITGFEAPVQRAFSLFALWLLGRIFDLDTELPTSLAAGALAILCVQPGALWEPGFQLSLLITLSICTLGPVLEAGLPQAWPRWLRTGGGALFAAQWALLPLLAYHFHQYSWPALFSALVSGAFTFAILALGLPLGLLGSWLPGAAVCLGWPLSWVLRALDGVSSFSAGLPGSAYSTGLIPLSLLAAFALWALAAIFSRGRHKAWILGLWVPVVVLALLWRGLPWLHRHPGLTRVWCLDIGQGDSTLLEFGDGRALLVDGGPARPDAGSWVVVPALRALGIQRLRWVVATHADADHVGGLAWVLGQFNVDELLWNGQASPAEAWVAVEEQARLHQVPQRALGSDIPRQAADGPWRVLAPAESQRRVSGPQKPDTNAASIVLRVEDWLLLTGDFPKEGEALLLERGLAPVQVLKVGHHGSRTSTSPDFVRALQPELALISCGRKNSYGHPHASALKALGKTPLLRTDIQGCLSLERRVDGNLKVQTWWPGDPARMRLPRERPKSAWRGLEGLKEAAWRERKEATGDQD